MQVVADNNKVIALRRRVVRGGNMDSSALLAWLDGIDGAALSLRKKRRGAKK
jgi:hypothetical protein